MTDEKKPAETEPTGADAGNRAPDEARRKLAKAALAAPILMTLAPRSVLGAGQCTAQALSVVLHSATPVDTLVASLAARPGLFREDLYECEDCLANQGTINQCTSEDGSLDEDCVKKKCIK